MSDKPPRREREFREAGAASDSAPVPRQRDMVGGVWFTLSLGRKHRADPKWLLPLICKAGGVTKRGVGSIKILDAETRFEIAADKADAFARQVASTGSGEKGVTISPAAAASEAPVHAAPRPRREDGPVYKVRSDKGEKLGTQPARASERAHKPYANPKDKGKPKRRGPAADRVGDAPRRHTTKPPRVPKN